MNLETEKLIKRFYTDIIKEETKNPRDELLHESMKKIMSPQWYSLLKNEFDRKYFMDLARTINNDRKNHEVLPSGATEIFKVFSNSNPYTIQVIIVGQDPYPDGSYDGRAFSNCGKISKISPSLRNIFKEIEDDIYDGFKIEQDPCLERWEDQGVFMLNRVLTVRKNSPASHRGIGWEIFTAAVLKILSIVGRKKVFMLWGNEAKKIEPIITNSNNIVLLANHPSPLSANKGGWFGNKHFSTANDFFEKSNLTKIHW